MSSDLLGEPSAIRSYLDPREFLPRTDLRSLENLGLRPKILLPSWVFLESSSASGGLERSRSGID
jgi:hypothetical protein